MDRSLCSSNTWVDIDLAFVGKAVSMTVRSLKEHRLALHHALLHLRSYVDSPHGLTSLGQISLLNLDSPLLAILVHKAHKYLVVEATHTFATDTKTFIFDPGLSF